MVRSRDFTGRIDDNQFKLPLVALSIRICPGLSKSSGFARFGIVAGRSFSVNNF